ncbi:FAD-dependent oxidoreductase [Thermoanaerobacterium sp. DL9XJH110]|uniref:FAD-dependent oxidoreductase n=1 Tax=Thermoanaerobacterium sp. DL9XJH110 TaxID=3386643 RepID=UPI003BB5B4F6
MIFNEGKIGNLKLKNRMVMLPIVTNLAQDGFVTDREIEYYTRRSKDVSLVIVEASYVNILGKFFKNQLGIDSDEKINGLKKLSNIIRKNGAKAGIQLAMHNPKFKPADFSKEEIQGFIEDFAKAAVRAKKAGFDMVELHFAHGWFVNQFLSPDVNKRSDEYGGSFERRARFAVEILHRVKSYVPDIAVICRINADDFTVGGFNIEESVGFAKMLEENGADGLNISAGVGSSSEYHISPMGMEDRPLLNLVNRIKKNVGIPVIAADKLGFAGDWERILKDNVADFIGIARGLISDPDCIAKLKKGKGDDIRYCIHCNQACIAYILKGLPISCMINPEVGRESEFDVKTDKPLNIAVIGGGPAGMAAAVYLAKKGHRVELFEKSDKLGGQLNIAKIPPYKGKIGRIVEYLERDLRKNNIGVHLNRNVTVEEIKNAPFDKVIIATGSVPLKIDADIISYQAVDVLSGDLPEGTDIIIIGGGLTGLETAEFLADRGKNVTVLEAKEEVGDGVFPMVRKLLLNRLKKLNVSIITEAAINRISYKKLSYNVHGVEKEIKFDDIVIAIGNKPDETLKELKGNDKYIFIGDCNVVATAVEAIREGAELSLKI